MKETFVTSDERLYCLECGEEIIRCKQCEHKFRNEDLIYCDKDKHFCKECKERL